MDLLSFIQTADPTKVRVVERQRVEDEPRLLDTTIGRVVPLLPIAPARAESKLDASVDKLFDEVVVLVSEAVEIVVEDAAPVQPRRQRKRKTIVSDDGGPSHPPKKLREDHGTPNGPPIGDSSHHSGANIAEAEVDSFARPFVPLMTVATTVTSTVDPAITVKEKFVGPYVFYGDSSGSGADHTIGGFFDLTDSNFILG
ncbi:hypothetical protein Tco_1552253, partial [Tanacetum coccineum]